ncbi:hypothetical protein [Streptomyces sp. NBC_00670]|uniref:hypothetical protein n=1 Tax=Streptomyces sp. NBC_00670 TaxID=2975804 RepID=UPI002E342D46|nr:hypothetical protein [Streptomyces sp. NBC_00670]
MEPTSWLGLLAVLVSTCGSAWGAWMGRTRRTVQEVPEGAELPPAPVQPEGTWVVSPEMYRWFQEQMTELYQRMRTMEDDLHDARTQGARTTRLLTLALVHIGHQDERLRAAGIPLVPMDPELIAARDAQ